MKRYDSMGFESEHGVWVRTADAEALRDALREAYQITHYGRGSMQDVDDVLERAIRASTSAKPGDA